MKKRLIKIFEANAAGLPDTKSIAVRIARVVETDETMGDKTVVRKKTYVGVPVNHARRLRKAYQSGGEAGMAAYLKQVEASTHHNNLMLR